MAKVQINEFKGLMPKIANDKLPDNMAQLACDLKTASGELVAYRRSTTSKALSGSEYKSLFEYLEGGDNHWVYYNAIVHWVRSPTANDGFERMYMTGAPAVASVGTITFTDGMTDGETLTVGSETFEYDIGEDGVAGANTLVGDSTTTTKELCASTLAALTPAADVTFTDNGDGTVTVTATTAGEAGNLIEFSETGAHITTDQYESANFLGGTVPGVDSDRYTAFVNDLQGAGTFDFDTDFYYPGAPVDSILTIGYSTGSTKYRAYFFTHVSRYGEEGPPSQIVETVDANGTPDWDGTSSCVLDGFVEPDDTDEHLKTVVDGEAPAIRIYRTSTDGDGNSAFLFVEEVAVDNTGPNSTAWTAYTYTDTDDDGVDGNLGAVCTSVFYTRAVDGMSNLRGHPGGFFVASKDNVLYFSEPFAPWAWPTDYQIPIDQEIVGIGVYGSTIVVATDGFIYTFSGPHPTSLYKTKLSFQPCLSQRGVVETDEGVMFPSLEGFQHVTAGGVNNVTRDMFKPEDWVNYELDTMHGTWYNKAYYGFYKSADYEGYILLDMLNGAITTGVEYHYAGYVAIAGGVFSTISFSNIEAPAVLNIAQWDSDTSAYRNYVFKSKRYILEKPVNFKVAQIILDTDFYNDVLDIISDDSTLTDLNEDAWDALGILDWGEGDLFGPFNAAPLNDQDINGDNLYSLSSLGVQSYVTFKVWVDSVLKFTKQVSDSTMFKLPRGFRDKKWEFGIEGMIPVKRLTVATSTEEIV